MVSIEDDWLRQLLGPETMTVASPATAPPAAPAQAFVASAVPVSKGQQKATQAFVTLPALRKANAVGPGKGRATVVAVRVDPEEPSDPEPSAPPAPAAQAQPSRKREKRARKVSPPMHPPPQHTHICTYRTSSATSAQY